MLVQEVTIRQLEVMAVVLPGEYEPFVTGSGVYFSDELDHQILLVDWNDDTHIFEG